MLRLCEPKAGGKKNTLPAVEIIIFHEKFTGKVNTEL